LEFDNYIIHPEFCYLSDHAPLIVDTSIIEEFIPKKQHIIIKNSEEEDKFITDIIKAIKKINTEQISGKDLLELVV